MNPILNFQAATLLAITTVCTTEPPVTTSPGAMHLKHEESGRAGTNQNMVLHPHTPARAGEFSPPGHVCGARYMLREFFQPVQLGSEAASASQRLQPGSACTVRVPLPSRHTPPQPHTQQSSGHARAPVHTTQGTQEAPLVLRGTENLEGKARPTTRPTR